jgi:hypothetical protein
MSETEYKSNGKIVNVKRVKSGEKDKKERDRIEIFFGPDKRGVDGLTELIQALQAIEVGESAKIDIRIGEQQGPRGTFQTAFVLVSQVQPFGSQQNTAKFVAKQDTTSKMKATAAKIRGAVES